VGGWFSSKMINVAYATKSTFFYVQPAYSAMTPPLATEKGEGTLFENCNK